MKKLLTSSFDSRTGRGNADPGCKIGHPMNSMSWLNSEHTKPTGIADSSEVVSGSVVDNEYEKPHPPQTPTPSVAKYLKSTKFKAYKSTRPDLLNDLNRALSEGLNKLASEGHADESKARLAVFKDVFQLFIENFTIYRPFLTSIKHEYESAIDKLVEDLDSYATIDSQTEMREQAHLAKTLHIQHAYDRKVADLEEKVSSLEKSLSRTEKERRSAQQEVRKIYDANVVLQKESDEMRSTCVTLTGSLTRLEEERKKAANLEAATQQELTSYKLSEQKAIAEIER